MFKILKKDFERNKSSKLSKLYILLYRCGNKIYYSNFKLKKLVIIPFIIINKLFKYIVGTNISFSTRVGEGFRVPHLNMVFIHPRAIIGNDFTIMHNVTIGANEHINNLTPPRIGDNVYIGTGAVLIGDISIGNNVTVGANAVVTRDVPSDSTVVEYNKVIRNKANLKIVSS